MIPIILLNWNGWEDTFACLQSLACCAEVQEVWLIDNGSTIDKTAEASRLFSQLRIISLERNFGWAGGNNRGLKQAYHEGYKFAYLLNNDCQPNQSFLTSVMTTMLTGKDIAAVGSVIAFEDPPDFVKFDGIYHEPGARVLQHLTGHRAVCSVNGAGMLVNLEAMNKYGYFNERFFCYGEEEEWCRRMLRSGLKLHLANDSIIVHSGEGSDVNYNALYYRTRNHFLSVLIEHKSTRARVKRYVRSLYYYVRAANEHRRLGQIELAKAIICGLQDAIMGNFGERTTYVPNKLAELLAHCWPLPAGTFR